MLNGDDNEKGFKTNASNKQKNKLHVQHTFSFFFLRTGNIHKKQSATERKLQLEADKKET